MLYDHLVKRSVFVSKTLAFSGGFSKTNCDKILCKFIKKKKNMNTYTKCNIFCFNFQSTLRIFFLFFFRGQAKKCTIKLKQIAGILKRINV